MLFIARRYFRHFRRYYAAYAADYYESFRADASSISLLFFRALRFAAIAAAFLLLPRYAMLISPACFVFSLMLRYAMPLRCAAPPPFFFDTRVLILRHAMLHTLLCCRC